MTVLPPIVLATVPAADWQDAATAWPELLGAEALWMRRLAKGVGLSGVRQELLNLLRRTSVEFRRVAPDRQHKVPPKDREFWEEVMGQLADQRRQLASHSTGRSQVAAFLPWLFGPGPDDHAGTYDSVTVSGHLAELDQLHSRLDSASGLVRVVEERRALFSSAEETDDCVLEWIPTTM